MSAEPGSTNQDAPRRGSDPVSAEAGRLADHDRPWRLWGPYQAARQWGTVREDYSADGDAWSSFPFEEASARAYRWGEDGIAGLCDAHGFLHLSVALWNGADERLKERFFGLTNTQGNHGEDVKEYWWPVDATPTHSWGTLLYRYPQAAFPYRELVEANAGRSRDEREYELADTGVLDEDRLFDVTVTHAKADADDVVILIEAINRGPDRATVHLIPQLWFRNTWAWGRDDRRPLIEVADAPPGMVRLRARHDFLGEYELLAEGDPDVLVCENETDVVGLWDAATAITPYPKNGVERAIVHGDRSAIHPQGRGTKAALRWEREIPPGGSAQIRLRLRSANAGGADAFADAAAILAARQTEADAFYAHALPAGLDADDRLVARRAFAGLLWGKQVYRYSVREWLEGDPSQPEPPPQRRSPHARNTTWKHLELADVLSMPDDWEYPWFAAWDLAFHAVTLAHIDPEFAKDQLLLLCREWAQHPDGQLPAYEWEFSDVNPPVQAWAAWQVYLIDGARDHVFLGTMLSKLVLNTAWWMNRKDATGNDLYEGGFLGMDNISFLDRSKDVPPGHRLEQSDATSWMAFASLAMLRMSQELARHDPAWEELSTTFLERFLALAEAIENFGSNGVRLWDQTDGFFYDVLVDPDGSAHPLRVRSFVGLVPLLAVTLEPRWVPTELVGYTQRRRWLEEHRGDLLAAHLVTHPDATTAGTLALVDPERWQRLLSILLDPAEFWSDHGVRSLSAAYRAGVVADVDGQKMSIEYDPGASRSAMFGGNSNWRGPVWLPVNALLIDALHTYAEGAGRHLRLESPTGDGQLVDLHQVADDLTDRVLGLFRPGQGGRRPSDPADHPTGPLWSAHPTFSEYFHGDTGAGLGASHQTGWTALVAHMMFERGRRDRNHR